MFNNFEHIKRNRNIEDIIKFTNKNNLSYLTEEWFKAEDIPDMIKNRFKQCGWQGVKEMLENVNESSCNDKYFVYEDYKIEPFTEEYLDDVLDYIEKHIKK